MLIEDKEKTRRTSQVTLKLSNNKSNRLKTTYFPKGSITQCFGGSLIEDNIQNWVNDLNDMIALMEIYFDDYINNYQASTYAPDVLELDIDRMISFNYTDTFHRYYRSSEEDSPYYRGFEYVHGKADLSKSFCNLVLGIDEYLGEEERKKNTEFIAFKKYYQRIVKKVDCDFWEWFDENRIDDDGEAIIKHVYVFGHSLDVTDADLFGIIFKSENVRATIFYHDEDTHGKLVANLVGILGQKEMLEKVYGPNPSIEFKKQQKTQQLLDSQCEIRNDLFLLRNLYKVPCSDANRHLEKMKDKIETILLIRPMLSKCCI